MVNGDPITAFDIEQRSKLIQVSTPTSRPARQEVIDELIDEKLKIQLLKRYTIEGIDKEVDNAFANMARRARHDAAAIHRACSASPGIKPSTLKSRIKAEITWNQIIRGRYQSSFQFSERDIVAEARGRAHRATTPSTGRLRLHAAPDPVRGAARLAATACESPRARRPRRCARASRIARKASRWRAALRDVAVRAHPVTKLGRPAAGAARHPRQDRDRPADRARGDARKASKSTRCAARRSRAPKTRRKSARSATSCSPRQFAGQRQGVS